MTNEWRPSGPASCLTDRGQVDGCDADPEHVDAISRDGLRIEGPVEQFTVRVPAVTPSELPDRVEHAAIAAKRHHTAAAAGPARSRRACVEVAG